MAALLLAGLVLAVLMLVVLVLVVLVLTGLVVEVLVMVQLMMMMAILVELAIQYHQKCVQWMGVVCLVLVKLILRWTILLLMKHPSQCYSTI